MTAPPEGPTGKATILIVDDEISNIEIMNEALGDDYEICFATSGEQALEVARLTMPDLILLDVVMPGMQGFEVCRVIKADPLISDIPVIFTTGLGDTEDEVRGLTCGAIDYVTKPIEAVILRNRVKNHVELKRLRDYLAALAVTDALTGLHNRRKLDGLLTDAATAVAQSRDWLSFIMLDIDFFKQFNDTYGHPSGDRCIRMVASALNRAVRNVTAQPARYGGEEFACVLPRADADQARDVATEIRRQVDQLNIPHEKSGIHPYVTVSIGIATARGAPELDAESWIQVADEQLYLAKTSGRNQIRTRVFEGPDAGAAPLSRA